MLKYLLNLQMFGEGGDGSGAAGASDAATGAENVGTEEKSGDAIVYGKQTDTTTVSDMVDTNEQPQEEAKASFDDLIKGEYKEDFEKKTQAIINKRFKETKGLQEALDSHKSIMSMLADKYGVEDGDIESLQAAIEDDDSFYEQEAYEKGLTVKQLKEVKALERENEAFREAEAKREQAQHSQEIYSNWMNEWNQFTQKYDIKGDLQAEVANPDFTRLLSNGISVEAAYKAIHMDDMIGGAMAKTASSVREGMANSIASRQSRPSENGLSSSKSSSLFKSDPNTLTNNDLVEIRRQVMRGAKISF